MRSGCSAPAKVLLVDDSKDGLLVRRLLLEEAGYRVETARGGDEALTRFTGSSFDLVVTDFRMPRMDGCELIAGIRKLNPNARIILLTGYVEALGLTEHTTGANVVIMKNSSEPANLLRWVKRLANSSSARKPVTSQKSAAAKARAAKR